LSPHAFLSSGSSSTHIIYTLIDLPDPLLLLLLLLLLLSPISWSLNRKRVTWEAESQLNPSWICEEATWESRIKFWEFLQSDHNSDTTILSSSSSSSSDVILLQSLDRWTGSKTLSTDYTHNWCLHIREWGFLWCIHTWCSVSDKWKSRWHPKWHSLLNGW
jgi:hypothetical protein